MSPPKTYWPPLLFLCSTNMAEITTIAALYLLWEFEERNPNAVVFGCMTSSVGAHSWVSFTTSSRNSAWMTAGSRRIFS